MEEAEINNVPHLSISPAGLQPGRGGVVIPKPRRQILDMVRPAVSITGTNVNGFSGFAEYFGRPGCRGKRGRAAGSCGH